ncbi:MAG TPA: glycosyltransferase family 4 protein [Anaerolineales bacterium]|nr:glycosyltransferase family 4 protein [Anaerolineales bacterium]
MHVLLIHQAFATLSDPGGTRHHEIARYLVARGHRVTVLTSQISYLTGKSTGRAVWLRREVDGEGVAIWRCYSLRSWHRSFFHRLLSFFSFTLSAFLNGLKVRNVDLVWGTSPPLFQGLTAWGLARVRRAAFLFEVRDLWPAFAVAVGVLRQPLLIRLSEWLERFLLRHANQVVVNSPGFIEHVRERGAHSVEMVPNGAEVGMFHPEDDGLELRRLHHLEGKFIVMYAGAHGISNDLGVALGAAEMLRGEGSIVFVFVGDGKEKPALMANARGKGLANVLFLPPVAKSEMPRLLAMADACLAILKPLEPYRTTYPNKVFDYMAAGRPVLLAIDGVIRELVEAARGGVFVRPGDPEALAKAIRGLAADRQMAQSTGLAGRDYVARHFDRPALAQKMEAVMAKTARGMD